MHEPELKLFNTLNMRMISSISINNSFFNKEEDIPIYKETSLEVFGKIP